MLPLPSFPPGEYWLHEGVLRGQAGEWGGGCRGKAGLLGKGMAVPESLRKEAWPCLGVPSLRGDTVLLFLGGWISGTPLGSPWRPPPSSAS